MSSDVAAPPPGMSPERIGIFTDAVLAIAMTLLLIEVPRPEGDEFAVGDGVSKREAAVNLGHFLRDQASSFYACLLAFMLLWLVWRRHHTLMEAVDRVTPAVIGWHFPLLLLAAFLPYPTTVLGHYADNPLAALFYGLTVLLLLVCRAVLQQLADDDRALRPLADRARIRRDTRVSWIAVGWWALTLLLVWWTPWIQILWFLTFAVGIVATSALRRSTPAQPPSPVPVASPE